MKAKTLMICVASMVVFAVTAAAVAQEETFLTPQQAKEIMYGPATKDNTPLQNELLWKEKCYYKRVIGEGTLRSLPSKHRFGFDEWWVITVAVDQEIGVTLWLAYETLPKAAALKMGDKLRFEGRLRLVGHSDTPAKRHVQVYLTMSNILE